MRLSPIEKNALSNALLNIQADVYLFGSRLYDYKQGGDIDILVVPFNKVVSRLKLALQIQKEFFKICEQSMDVVVYRNTPFCNEILKNAKKIHGKNFDPKFH